MNHPNSGHLPFVIGLTGVIGTGKSLVRKMLEHKGALTVDADQLAQQAYNKDSCGYQAVTGQFGKKILDKNGEIDRTTLGNLVFNNAQALADLEALIHPLVSQAVNKVVNRSPLPIIVVEAIKLFESDLKDNCDEIWIITSPIDQIYGRLASTRAMNRSQVNGRLQNQHLQFINNSVISVVNDGTIADLQQRVSEHWKNLAEASPHFNAALVFTNQLLKPFDGYLLSTDAAAASGFFPKKTNPYNYFLWRLFLSGKTNSYISSSINHFTAICETGTSKIDPLLFNECLSMLEQFFRLHLCDTLSVICSSQDESEIRQLGFDQCDKPSAQALHTYPLGYNHLCRQLLPSLELFRET